MNDLGHIMWTDHNRLQLVAAIRANMALISENASSKARKCAWENVYRILRRQGLPELSLNRLQQAWVRMLVSYVLFLRNPTIPGSPVNIAMKELLRQRNSIAKRANALP